MTNVKFNNVCTIEYNVLIVFYQSFMQKNAYLNIINVNLSSFVNSPRGDCRKKKRSEQNRLGI